MDSTPPLTVDSLRQFAKDEKELQDGLTEDCQQLEDVMVRLAGPTLQGIEEDTAKLEELQAKLSAPALEGIKRDMQRITKILRKLAAPIDQSISEDTTLLTGIAARAQGSNFSAHGRGNVAGRVGAVAPQVVPGTPHTVTRPTGAYQQSAAMGYSGASPVGAPIGSAGYSALRPAPLPSSQSANSIDGIDLTVTSGATSGGMVGIGANPYAPSLPPAVISPAGTAAPPQSTNPFGVTVHGASAGALPPSPFLPPSPSSVSPHATPGGSAQQLQQPGSVSPFPAPSPPIPIPHPPPPLPPPPPDGCDPCAAVLHLADVLGGQLLAIAQALHCLCEQTVKTAPPPTVSQVTPGVFPPMEWTDPPAQSEVNKDLTTPEQDLQEIVAIANAWGK